MKVRLPCLGGQAQLLLQFLARQSSLQDSVELFGIDVQRSFLGGSGDDIGRLLVLYSRRRHRGSGRGSRHAVHDGRGRLHHGTTQVVAHPSAGQLRLHSSLRRRSTRLWIHLLVGRHGHALRRHLVVVLTGRGGGGHGLSVVRVHLVGGHVAGHGIGGRILHRGMMVGGAGGRAVLSVRVSLLRQQRRVLSGRSMH